MKKTSLASALATKTPPTTPNDNRSDPEPAAETVKPARLDVIATTIRIDPDRLERLKVIAHRRRMRVNELLLEGVDHILALHGAKTS
jgi:hypothetical protein